MELEMFCMEEWFYNLPKKGQGSVQLFSPGVASPDINCKSTNSETRVLYLFCMLNIIQSPSFSGRVPTILDSVGHLDFFIIHLLVPPIREPIVWKCEKSPHLRHLSGYDRLGLVAGMTAPCPCVSMADGVGTGLLCEFVEDGHFLCQAESGQVRLLLAFFNVTSLFLLCCFLQQLSLSCLLPHHRAEKGITAPRGDRAKGNKTHR